MTEGIMAEFTVRAVRTGKDEQKVQLIIHGTEVVGEVKGLDLYGQVYEELFLSVKSKIKEVGNGQAAKLAG